MKVKFMSLDQIIRCLKLSKKEGKNQESIQSSTTQDTHGKVTNSQLDTTNESQEVSPFQKVTTKQK